MKLSKREKVLIFLVLIISGILAYVFLFLTPNLDETKKIENQNTTNKATIQTNNVLKQRAADIAKQLKEDEDKLEEFGDSIKSAFDQPPVLVYIFDTINKDNKCDKIMISFESFGRLGQVKYCNILVTMKAKYEDLKNVMKDLADSEYFVKIVNFSVESVPKEVSKTDTSPDETDTEDSSFTDNFLEGETVLDEKLAVSMNLEFYYIGTEIPADTTYDFTDGAVQYGGDMFHRP